MTSPRHTLGPSLPKTQGERQAQVPGGAGRRRTVASMRPLILMGGSAIASGQYGSWLGTRNGDGGTGGAQLKLAGHHAGRAYVSWPEPLIPAGKTGLRRLSSDGASAGVAVQMRGLVD